MSSLKQHLASKLILSEDRVSTGLFNVGDEVCHHDILQLAHIPLTGHLCAWQPFQVQCTRLAVLQVWLCTSLPVLLCVFAVALKCLTSANPGGSHI